MMIRVYSGEGSSALGSPILIGELKRHLHAEVAPIEEDEMKGSDDWKKNTSLLVFSGKSVTQFKEALGPKVLDEILHGVAEGAFDYTGLCAGACLGIAHIKYRMQYDSFNDETVIRNTGLGFFNIYATGPSRSVSPLPFSGGTENLHLVTLRNIKDQTRYNSFFWGGPSLIPLEKISSGQGEILSVLEGESLPMTLRRKFGQGHVTLCTHHPEIHAGNIGRWAEFQKLPSHEVHRLENLAARLDGRAFKQFLFDAGLAVPSTIKKAADLTAALS